MKLRGKRPDEVPKRLKILLFGVAGSGKTTAAIQLPRPYVIDCEKGTDHYGPMLEKSAGAVFQTTLMVELIEEVRSLVSTKHDFRTLVVDPISLIYQNLLDKCEQEVGTQFGRHYGEANKHMKRLTNLIMCLDMNVVITAHSKNEYGDNMRVIGTTFDGWKRLDYMFDLVICLERRGQKRVATVIKTRLAAFPDADQFEWSYDAVADRYGREILEKQSDTVQLATQEHVSRFNQLVNQLSDQEHKRLGIDRALSEFQDLSDMPNVRIVKGIDLIEQHLSQEAKQ